MCGRVTQHFNAHDLGQHLQVAGPPINVRPRYNLAPTTSILAVRTVEGERQASYMRCGLIPAWWKKTAKEVPATFNARAETVTEKPMFRGAWKARRRCIIPVSGFYEWETRGKAKIPHLFTAADGAPILSIAGMWEAWRDPKGEAITSCTMIVTSPNAWMERYHDRMVVVLEPEQHEAWLSGEIGEEGLVAAREDLLREHIVDSRVNRTGVGDDDPTLLQPVPGPLLI
ncbi:SOS response-associated peptidase [Rhodovarius crocodyli]|uniref:Abasic site processing protein n=1 Tax=Rhodovarius crocodyli TaxID=1979269 RepID=A0A437MN86_9PROT|nr:SOS response-associated peptidase [Rhodovarius crocodyli]RVT99114.1 SOS response-associated peptidase [Rhodovarius crocodyli]